MLTGEEFWRLAELEGGEDPAVVGEFGAELSLGAVEEPEQSWCCWGGSGGTGDPGRVLQAETSHQPIF